MSWWLSGGILMWLIAGVGIVLYAVIAERALSLHRQAVTGPNRAAELARLLAHDPQGTSRILAAGEELELTRGLWLARALCGCLPLLGLLGTVFGIGRSFNAIADVPGAVRAAGSGVSEALVTTQFALALAVPALIATWWLGHRAEELAGDLAEAVLNHHGVRP